MLCVIVRYVDFSSVFVVFFFFKQKTAYEMRISDWSSDVCSSDLSGYCFGMRTHARRYCYGVEMQRRQLAEGRMKRLLVGTAITGSVCMLLLAPGARAG